MKIQNKEICVSKILESQNAICIMSKETGEYSVNNYVNEEGRSLLKVVNDNFRSQHLYFPMADGSPFVEKFVDTINRIVESGISNKFLDVKSNFTNKAQGFIMHKIKDPYSIYRIIIVLGFGFLLSILTLCFELLVFNCSKMKILNVVKYVFKK